jgi:protein transport protein SEC61 subunit gamma-like protein
LVKSFLKKVKRVLEVSSKPSKDEFLTSFKISLLGIAVIGVITFVVQMLFSLFQLPAR